MLPLLNLQKMYMQEREALCFVEDYGGFLAYKVLNPTTWYIQDIYVLPEHREKKLASELFRQCVQLAKKSNISTLLGSVDLSAPAPERSMKAVLSVGFVPFNIENNSLIWFKLEV